MLGYFRVRSFTSQYFSFPFFRSDPPADNTAHHYAQFLFLLLAIVDSLAIPHDLRFPLLLLRTLCNQAHACLPVSSNEVTKCNALKLAIIL